MDIEDTSIRIMAVDGKRVQTAASLPLEPGLVHDGVIIDPATVGRRIGELMAAQGITERRAVVSISGIHSIYRVVNIPKLPKNLMDEAAKREMERLMPVPLNELYTSWQAISISDIDTVICFVGMPRNTVDAMLETLRQAGLQAEAMDVRPLALARVADERDALIINAKPFGFDIVIMIDGIPELLRSLPFPTDADSPDEKIDEVKEELERTVAFYNSTHKGNEITKSIAVFISGELSEMLAGTLEYRSKPLPQLLMYSDSLNTSEYAANIGLALRQTRVAISPARVNLNVIPEIYQLKPFPIIQLASWAFILLAMIVLGFYGISTMQNYRGTLSLQRQVNDIQSLVNLRQGTEASVKQLQTQIGAAKKAATAFQKPLDIAKAQRAKVNGDISKVTSLLPGIIDVTSISYGTGITVNGSAPDDTTVADYVRALRNSNQFSQVLISSMKETEFNTWTFTLALK
ncbi:MAG: pilus assembly protein PilM [Dehalococcoidia bacterium]|nr:pilus assembly protein PilM [Dehalococcoidia bacterium]